MSITVCVPMAPPSALLPNARYRRGGFYPGIAAAAECRMEAKSAALKVLDRVEPIRGEVHLTIHVAYGYRQVTPDLDGTISSVKSMLDGIVDAGLMDDDSKVVKITATQEKLKVTKKSKPTGHTILTIAEAST